MATLEKIAEVPKGQGGNGIFRIQVDPAGHVYSRLENRIDPSQPFTLTIRPIAEQQTLRTGISMTTSGSPDDSALGVSDDSTFSFGNKCLTVSTKNQTDYIETYHE